MCCMIDKGIVISLVKNKTNSQSSLFYYFTVSNGKHSIEIVISNLLAYQAEVICSIGVAEHTHNCSTSLAE